jgi:ADP-heptose:LPS heptosyltransferase
MKILVLQLARLGDIYQTWPVLRALKRANPGAEIHLLTRSKFAAAAPKDGVLSRHWLLDTRSVLEPLIDEKPALDVSLEKLTTFSNELRAQNFDRVINLTFSPFSSYLTREITRGTSVQVTGYTRFEDGYLSIPDDGSAYFYAQVGVGRANRLHVTDLFAYVAGVELTEEDWSTGQLKTPAREEKILVHIGASVAGKTFSWSKWLQVVKHLLQAYDGEVVLVGSKEEVEQASKITGFSSGREPINLVGKTSLDELFDLVSRARLLIGGDSGPVQIASITGTPVLNLSLPIVSFWETGPRSKGSRIFTLQSEDEVTGQDIANEAVNILHERPSVAALAPFLVRVPGRTVPYIEMRPQAGVFEWEFLRALYMSEPFPVPPSDLYLLGLTRLNEVNTLAREQIESLRVNAQNKTAGAILDRADEIMNQITDRVPELAPLVRWFRTERMRIGPMSMENLISATDAIHARLGDVIGLYLDTGTPAMPQDPGSEKVEER